MSDTKSTLFMFKNCEKKEYESPKIKQNSLEKLRNMSKTLEINLNMNNKKFNNNNDKIKDYEDEVLSLGTKALNNQKYNPYTDRDNIFKTNSVSRVVYPGLLKHKHRDPTYAESEIETKLQSNNFNYESIIRPKVTDSVRTKITLMSKEFSSPSRK